MVVVVVLPLPLPFLSISASQLCCWLVYNIILPLQLDLQSAAQHVISANLSIVIRLTRQVYEELKKDMSGLYQLVYHALRALLRVMFYLFSGDFNNAHFSLRMSIKATILQQFTSTFFHNLAALLRDQLNGQYQIT